MPLYCTVPATRNKPADFRLTAFNVPIDIGGVRVKPGDIMVGDEDGLAVIPAEAISDFMENIQIRLEVESEIEQAVNAGAPVEDITRIMSKKQYKGKPR